MSSLVYQRIKLYALATQDNTMDNVPVIRKCKDERSWCLIQMYACFKAGVKCGVACHGGDGNSKSDNPNK